MREKTELIEKQMQDSQGKAEYNWYDIVDCIELSYLLKGKEEIKTLDSIIKYFSSDGINTWGIFIKYCYDKYLKHEYDDLETFISCEIEDCAKEFLNKYFEKENKTKKYILDTQELERYMSKTFDTDACLIYEIANYMKTLNNSLTIEYYKGNKINIELYVINLIAILNNSNMNVDISEFIDNNVLKEEK